MPYSHNRFIQDNVTVSSRFGKRHFILGGFNNGVSKWGSNNSIPTMGVLLCLMLFETLPRKEKRKLENTGSRPLDNESGQQTGCELNTETTEDIFSTARHTNRAIPIG
ncbi:hypothetical protein JCM33374_g4765 [Metschnikowia sp. JCM 33374]|nr:hypothetical protein JCM33374_g4765 [Metschnikowia sp. JCM 33374]